MCVCVCVYSSDGNVGVFICTCARVCECVSTLTAMSSGQIDSHTQTHARTISDKPDTWNNQAPAVGIIACFKYHEIVV